MAQNVTIQGLTSKEISEISTSTPLPMQIANTENFQKMTVGQLQSDCYATCTTASGTAAKTATVTNFPDFEIHIGSKINVIFENENTASNVTLQILNQDGSEATGAVPVVAKNSANVRLGSGSIKAGTYSFSYNGTYFVADTYLVEQTSTYTKYADGHVEYVPISTLTDGSAAAVNTSAVKGALADYRKYTMLANEDFDMNSLRTEGLYQIPEGFNHSISNFPITSTPDGGGIIIVNTWGGSYLTQEVQLYNKNEKYYRSTRYDNGVKFNDWQIIALKSDLTYQLNHDWEQITTGVFWNCINGVVTIEFDGYQASGNTEVQLTQLPISYSSGRWIYSVGRNAEYMAITTDCRVLVKGSGEVLGTICYHVKM